MAKASLKPASDIKIGPKVAAFKPRLPQTLSSNPDDHKAKEHDNAAKKEHDGFQFKQPNDSEKHFEAAKERIRAEAERELYGWVVGNKGKKVRKRWWDW